jgi:hypothetical protein
MPSMYCVLPTRSRPNYWLGLVATNAGEAYLAASGHLLVMDRVARRIVR